MHHRDPFDRLLIAQAQGRLSRPAIDACDRFSILELNPTELALSAGRVPGQHALVTLRFSSP